MEENLGENGIKNEKENCRVQVGLRIRPFNQKELIENPNKCLTSQNNQVFF